MMTVTNIAFIRAKSGRGDDLGDRLMELVEPSRDEAGCINYDLHRSEADPICGVCTRTGAQRRISHATSNCRT